MCSICRATGADVHAADPRDKTDCPYTPDGAHQWTPDPDDPDIGDVCALCGVGR